MIVCLPGKRQSNNPMIVACNVMGKGACFQSRILPSHYPCTSERLRLPQESFEILFEKGFATAAAHVGHSKTHRVRKSSCLFLLKSCLRQLKKVLIRFNLERLEDISDSVILSLLELESYLILKGPERF